MFRRRKKELTDKNSQENLYLHSSKLKKIRNTKLDRQKIIILLLLTFLIIILIMGQGSSKNSSYDTKSKGLTYEDNPEEVGFPNQSSGPPGGFNISGNFDQLPSFNPPADWVNNDWGGNIDLPDGDNNGDGFTDGFDTVDLPDITRFPTINPPGEPPEFPKPTGSLPDPKVPTIGAPNGEVGNFSQPERKNKARNLPQIHLFNFSSINFDLPGIGSIEFSVKIEEVMFISILFFALFLNKAIVPLLIRELEAESKKGEKSTSIFVKPSKAELERIKRARERAKRLLVFKDHVDDLIIRSEHRLETKGPEKTIIKGYHDLDTAFGEFAKLKRFKDITPLEHSHSHFESGEIDNDKLEKIVELFYLSRYGQKMMSNKDGLKFIEHLSKLVIKEFDENLMDPEFSDINE